MNASLGITPEHRDMLLTFFSRFITGMTVLAYGSRVKGTARPYSDLDLVVFATPAQRALISELKEALDESNLPFLVDVLVWDELPESFHRNIAAEHVVVQEGKTDLSVVFRGIIEGEKGGVQKNEKGIGGTTAW